MNAILTLLYMATPSVLLCYMFGHQPHSSNTYAVIPEGQYPLTYGSNPTPRDDTVKLLLNNHIISQTLPDFNTTFSIYSTFYATRYSVGLAAHFLKQSLFMDIELRCVYAMSPQIFKHSYVGAYYNSYVNFSTVLDPTNICYKWIKFLFIAQPRGAGSRFSFLVYDGSSTGPVKVITKDENYFMFSQRQYTALHDITN